MQHAQARAHSIENRIADRITAFAGSMQFVYIHIIWFSCWIGFGVEDYPYGLLTMIVSLALSHQILELTKAIHAYAATRRADK